MLATFNNVSKIYHSRFFSKEKTIALDNINFSIKENKILGIIGNSGSGKSTIAKILAGLLKPTTGNIYYKDKPDLYSERKLRKELSKEIQIVFQHPENSLNPNMTVLQNLLEPIKIHRHYTKKEAANKIEEKLALTKLSKDLLRRYPKAISGGEAQRIMICRALLMMPSLIILDEPTSMLDVTTQEQIIKLLEELKEKEHLTYLFVTHDLELARYFCDEIIIMEKGRMIECGQTEEIFSDPKENFTRNLIKNFEELKIY